METELVKLEEEEERLEEELLAAQRVADLIRKRNESKARIAALKARASTTPGRGSPSLGTVKVLWTLPYQEIPRSSPKISFFITELG